MKILNKSLLISLSTDISIGGGGMGKKGGDIKKRLTLNTLD